MALISRHVSAGDPDYSSEVQAPPLILAKVLQKSQLSRHVRRNRLGFHSVSKLLTENRGMRVKILGTGTSTGVPVPGCRCTVCTSSNSCNKRLRTSIAVEAPDGTTILVDTSPDLRMQALTNDIRRIDAVLYTHAHADHIFGIDDLRAFNFTMQRSIDLYATTQTGERLRQLFQYAFQQDPEYEGGSPPRLDLHSIEPLKEFTLKGISVLPLPLKHGQMDVLGFRFGNFAYLTDCSLIPESSADLLLGLDVLVLDALRVRPHKTHFSVEEAVLEVKRLGPKKTYLIHLSHEVDHDDGNALVKTLTTDEVELAWDGLHFEVSNP